MLALKYHKKQTDALQGLCRILAGVDDVELIQLLNSVYDREDGDYLVRSLMGLASNGVLAYYGKTVTGAEIRQCNTVEDLFNTVKSKM